MLWRGDGPRGFAACCLASLSLGCERWFSIGGQSGFICHVLSEFLGVLLTR
jgi:hypothetical protein